MTRVFSILVAIFKKNVDLTPRIMLNAISDINLQDKHAIRFSKKLRWTGPYKQAQRQWFLLGSGLDGVLLKAYGCFNVLGQLGLTISILW